MDQLFLPDKQEFEIDTNRLKLNADQILKGLGMKRTDADDYLLDLIEELTQKSIKLAQPRAGFSFYLNPQFDLADKCLLLKNHRFSLGKTVTGMLKKSEAVILFAVTIGHEVEAFSKQQMKAGNSLEGYIIDLVGSELAESATDFLHDELERLVNEKGYGLSNRYSPGYCNWPVSDQHQLFDLIGEVNCGIQINESSLMSPVKSVSGIVGVGKSMKRVDYKCRLCDDEKCILRYQF